MRPSDTSQVTAMFNLRPMAFAVVLAFACGHGLVCAVNSHAMQPEGKAAASAGKTKATAKPKISAKVSTKPSAKPKAVRAAAPAVPAVALAAAALAAPKVQASPVAAPSARVGALAAALSPAAGSAPQFAADGVLVPRGFSSAPVPAALAARQALPPEALTASGGLRLQYILDAAIQGHPSIQAARLDMRASGEDQRAIERQRWPALSAVLENKSNNTSVSSTRMLRLEQTVWDAGRLSARIREAESNIGLNQSRIYISAQTLSLQVLAAWQSLLAADGRIRVARDTLRKLAEYRQQMERRVQAEASPPIDLELVMSRTLQTEVELTQALNARQVALGRIEQYSGLESLSLEGVLAPVEVPAMAAIEPVAARLLDLDWVDAVARHPNVQKARQDAVVAQARIEAKRAEQFPQLYVRLDQPINGANNDVAGFVGFRYTPGAGLSTGIEAQALATRAASMDQAVDTAAREVKEALFTDRDDFNASRSRLLALEKAVAGSRVVLDSYGRQFNASRKTWLDLMNAVRELAQNQYALVDSQAAMQAALYRLQVRLGEAVHPAP